MKFEWNKKYTTISMYVIIVAVALMVLFQLIGNIGYIGDLIGGFIGIISPFLFGLIFAYILYPVLNFFETKILPPITGYKLSRRAYRYTAIIFTVLISFGALGCLVYFVLPALLSSIADIVAEYTPHVKAILNDLFVKYNMEDALSVVQDFFSQAVVVISKSIESIIEFTSAITAAIINFFIGVFVAIYLWAGKEKYIAQTKKLFYACFPKKFVDKLLELCDEANSVFSGFITGKVIDSVIIGVLCYIGMLILDIPYALLISVIVGVTNVIPYFGPFVGAIPSAILLLIVDPLEAVWFGIFIIVLQQIDGAVIGPKILGVSTGLSALWVIFSVSFFGGAFGLVGMLVGVPLFALIYAMIRKAVNNRLQAKELPTNINSYTSDKNKIICKDEKVSRGKQK